jgi:hypothetical protein
MTPTQKFITNTSGLKTERRASSFALAVLCAASVALMPLKALANAASIKQVAMNALALRQPTLPARLPMGAAMIHRYEEPRVTPSLIAVTVWVPMRAADSQGLLVNMNSTHFPADLPQRFVIGDGGATRSFLGIDLTPDSPLSRAIEAIYQEAAPGDVVEFLRAHTNELIEWTAGSSYNDGRKELPWDVAIPAFNSDLGAIMAQAANEQLYHYPIASGEELPVVGLESYIALGKGYCLEKALLASLVLSRAGLRHRLVNGAVSMAPGVSVGHTWIELADGRVLDPAWEIVEEPGRGHPIHADWIKVGGEWRYENQNYLVLELQ